jgi:hypothetical protein
LNELADTSPDGCLRPVIDAQSNEGFVGRTLEARFRRASLVTFDSDDHWVARQFSADIAAAIQSVVEREPS